MKASHVLFFASRVSYYQQLYYYVKSIKAFAHALAATSQYS